VADGYNSFIGSLRTKTNISPDILELSICRVGVLNKAVYEWNIHGPLALKAGVSVNELSDVATLPTFTDEDHSREAWARSVLTRTQRAVVKYTDEMTVRVAVTDEVFQELQEVLPSDRAIVELTATIAGYNCVSRFLVALDVGEHNDGDMKSPQDMIETA
jgi:alkylhydroperoxidase family enzyme